MQAKQCPNPQLEEIKVQLDAASQKARFIVNSVSFEQLKQRPQPDKWSIAECLVHLNLSSQAEINVLPQRKCNTNDYHLLERKLQNALFDGRS